MRIWISALGATAIVIGFAVGPALAMEEHEHGDRSPAPDDQQQSAADDSHSDHHGRGMQRRHKMRESHHSQAPTVVINIYSGGGMGMDMMGHGGGMGMMGQGGGMMMDGDSAATDRQITAVEVREHMAGMVGRMNGGWQVSEVEVLDQDLISAELTEADGTVVRRMIVNRHSGAMMRAR